MMERLTGWDGEYAYELKCFSGEPGCPNMGTEECADCEDNYEIYRRLAQYEDTGLYPEEIASVMKLAEKMNVVDLVRENLNAHNTIKHQSAEIERLRDENASIRNWNACEAEQYAKLLESDKRRIDLERFADAEAEGRLVILPCKVGDIVYSWHKGKVVELKVVSIEFRNLFFINFRTVHDEKVVLLWADFEIGKTIFLTREEAEKALKGESE